jgi:hypothetical protein
VRELNKHVQLGAACTASPDDNMASWLRGWWLVLDLACEGGRAEEVVCLWAGTRPKQHYAESACKQTHLVADLEPKKGKLRQSWLYRMQLRQSQAAYLPAQCVSES